MHISHLLTLPLILGLTLASAVPAPLSSENELEKRAVRCPDKLTKAQCHASSGAKQGVYCGYCPQVLGTDWAISGHNQ